MKLQTIEAEQHAARLVGVSPTVRKQDVTLRWSPGGHGVLVQTHTDVDATGGSYYGGTGLYLMQAASKKAGEPAFECLVPLPKDGPIAAAEWEPTQGKEFVVIAGAMPPAAALYNLEAEQVYSFGAAHRNVVSWAPHGRFLALAGFGNLAGDVDFWDRHKKKKMGSQNIPCAVSYGWSPCSRFFMSATLAPRMNVDNGVRVYRYDGSGPVATKADRSPLFECFWLPADAALYPDRGISPGSKQRAKASGDKPAAAAKPQAYRPPGARGRAGGGSLASMIRAEREAETGKAGTKVPKKGGIVGAAPEKTESRNAKRKEAARKRKEAEEAAAALARATLADAPPPPPAAVDVTELGPEELAKKAKGLKKKSDLELTTAERAAVLRAIAELDGKSSQKAVRKSAESILGAPEGSLDAKKAAIKEVCQEEMNRLEQQKPPKKQKRKKATLGAEGAGEGDDDDAPAEYVPKKPKVKPVSKDGQAERTGKFSKAESAEVMQAAEDEAKSRGVTVSQMVEKSDWGRGDKNPWRSIAEKFPQRSARSILGHVKRNGHSGAKQKGVRWTVGESQALKEAFDKNPSDWTQIAQGFDRTPGACRDRYRTLYGEPSAPAPAGGARTIVVKEAWTDAELTALVEAHVDGTPVLAAITQLPTPDVAHLAELATLLQEASPAQQAWASAHAQSDGFNVQSFSPDASAPQ